MTTISAARHLPAGPPLPPIAIATVALFMASLILPIILTSGDTFPSPYSDEAPIIGYFRDHPGPVLLTALLQFAASLPLGIFAATASVRLNHLGVRAPGPTIGLVGGILASASMALSGLLTWTLTRPEILDHAELIRLIHDLAFITGGPGFAVPTGLLLAGIAVPGLLARLLPRWLAWPGLAIAALGIIATLTVAIPALAILLPIVRFPALAWIVITAFLLPRQRSSIRKENR
ncbi:hypothetical protein [Microbacterium sp. MPKO10]|uniref:hypothetical protein n=1 Tax=Microbacterium sp. MPKO10 TaxID=2989818 RepID=UPI0022355723|nr:hypothetical protein [Microbacterium sp. MPKO10]MCW4458786.1 hypothetical protein [Microbacterium sp. MPKO10]